jgi:hypothetical protein
MPVDAAKDALEDGPADDPAQAAAPARALNSQDWSPGRRLVAKAD